MNPKYIANAVAVLSNQQYVFIRRDFLSWECDALAIQHLNSFSFLKVKDAEYVLMSFLLCTSTASCQNNEIK